MKEEIEVSDNFNIVVRKLSVYDNNKESINMEIKLPNSDNFIPFTARGDDCESLGRELYSRAMNKEFGKIKIIKGIDLRERKNKSILLKKLKDISIEMCALEDAEKLDVINEDEKEILNKLRKYRVDLYRLDKKENWYKDVSWPEKPKSK